MQDEVLSVTVRAKLMIVCWETVEAVKVGFTALLLESVTQGGPAVCSHSKPDHCGGEKAWSINSLCPHPSWRNHPA